MLCRNASTIPYLELSTQVAAFFMGPTRKVKGEAETLLLAFAAKTENKGKIEIFMARPGLVRRQN
jgi:hypothetical protein